MAPVGVNAANVEGTVSEKILEYYKRRAQGGPGLVIVEAVNIKPGGKSDRIRCRYTRIASYKAFNGCVKLSDRSAPG